MRAAGCFPSVSAWAERYRSQVAAPVAERAGHLVAAGSCGIPQDVPSHG